MTDLLTKEQFAEALPAKVRKGLNQNLIDQINGTLSNPEEYENFRDNLISHGQVLAQGKFKLTGYICAVRYVSYKLQNRTSIESYTMTFPGKVLRFQQNGVSAKDISSYVAAYNKSKLVNLIMEQSMVPSWVLNQDMFQKALNVQARLMIDPNVSHKVQSDAANSVLTHLKRPEAAKLEIDVTTKDTSVVDALREATEKLVIQQKQALLAGSAQLKDVAHAPVMIEAEYEDVS